MDYKYKYFIKFKLNNWDYIRLIVIIDKWRNEIEYVKYCSWMEKDKMWWIVYRFNDEYNFEEFNWRIEML